jgi:predicted esterase
LKGFSGDVVATWMTKQDRLTEIDDFSIYLSDLYEKYTNQIPKGCKRIIFGFSQGGTSAFRWMYKNKVSYDKILAYSSWIPEDLDFSKSQTPIHEKKIIYTIGKQDQFTSEEKRALLKEIIRRNGLHVDFEYYDGMHRVEKKQLKYIFKKHIMV